MNNFQKATEEFIETGDPVARIARKYEIDTNKLILYIKENSEKEGIEKFVNFVKDYKINGNYSDEKINDLIFKNFE